MQLCIEDTFFTASYVHFPQVITLHNLPKARLSPIISLQSIVSYGLSLLSPFVESTSDIHWRLFETKTSFPKDHALIKQKNAITTAIMLAFIEDKIAMGCKSSDIELHGAWILLALGWAFAILTLIIEIVNSRCL